MTEFLLEYGIDLASVVAILAVVSPFLRARVISDKNITKVFDNVKQKATMVQMKAIDITNSITRLNNLADEMRQSFIEEQKRINETVLAFQQDELYQKMLNGLSQLDTLEKIIAHKDQNIAALKEDIKKIKASLTKKV